METRIMRKVVLVTMCSVTLSLLAGTAAQAATTILDAVADAEIDQETPDTALGSATSIRVENRDPIINPPGNVSWGLFKWDLSGIAPGGVADVTLSIPQLDSGVGSVYVYGIQEGDWDESTVTWNNYVGTETLVLLGEMFSLPWLASNPDANLTTFNDPNLTAWVQSWVDGTQANYGLLFKWAGTQEAVGDTFLAREHSLNYPAELIIVNPEFCGDEGTVYLSADLDNDCHVNWGDFSVFASQWLWCTDPEDPNCDQYWK